MPLTALVPLLPLLAGAFAVPQYLPQLLRVRRLGAAAGVSWSWAALAAVNNLAWAGYFVWSGVPSGLVAVLSCALVAGLLTHALTRLGGGVAPRVVAGVAAWVVVMALAGLLGGRLGLGAAMNVALIVQVAPSVVTAWRSRDVSGISVGTWLLVMGELTCFGLFGLATGDRTLLLLGVVGDAAGLLMLARVGWERVRQERPTAHPVTAPVPVTAGIPG